MDGRTERRRSFIINAVYFILIFGIGFLLFKYAVPYVLPFIIGFAIAFMLKPIVRFLSTKLRLNHRFCGEMCIRDRVCAVVPPLFDPGHSRL